MSAALFFVLLVSLATVAFAGWARGRVADDAVAPEMGDLAHALQRLNSAYIARQTATLGLFGSLLFVALLWFADVLTAIGFLIGVLCSAAAFYLIIHGALRLATKTGGSDQEAERLDQASHAGRLQAAASIGLGLLGLGGFYVILVLMTPTGRAIELNPLIGLALGITLVTLCARLGGDLFTRSTVRARHRLIRDDEFPSDLRNPAAVMDVLGYNAGAHAGLVLELFSAFMLSLIGAMLIGELVFGESPLALQYPLMLAGFSLLAFLAGELLVRRPRSSASLDEFFRALFTSIGLTLISYYVLALVFAHYVPQAAPGAANESLRLYTAALIGLGLGALVLLLVLLTDQLRDLGRLPEKPPAWQRLSGHTLLVLALCVGLWGAHVLAEAYGLAIAVFALQSLAAPLMVLAAYGTISSNKIKLRALLGNAAEAPDRDSARLERLVLLSVRSFGLLGGALAPLLLFVGLVHLVQRTDPQLVLELTDMRVLAGLLLGGLLPYLFCAFNRETVERNAVSLQQEVRQQFALHPEILTGGAAADLLQPAELLARRSLAALAWPLFTPILATVLVGLLLGVRGLAGAVAGTILSSLLVTVVLRDATRAETGRRHTDPKPTFFFEGYALGPAIGPVLATVCLTALLLVPYLD